MTKTITLHQKKLAVALLAAFLVVGALFVLLRPGADLPEDPNFDFPRTAVILSVTLPKGGEKAVEAAVALYKKKHANVSFSFQYVDPQNYMPLLKQQLNFGRPPDIYAFQNDYINSLSRNLETVPTEVFSESYLDGSYLPSLVEALKTEELKGVPLSTGSLALLVNPAILKETNVEIPESWDEVADAALKINKKEGRRLIRGTIALGTSNNVDHAGDILAALMLQNGSLIVSADRKRALFNEPETSSYFPGTEALKFYISFANPNKDIWSFEPSRERSLNEFAKGTVAMMLGTPDDAAYLSKNNLLKDFVVARIPQVEGGAALTALSYWGVGVSKSTTQSLVAFDFLKFLTNKKNQTNFMRESELPSGRQDVLSQEAGSDKLKGFIDSNEIAQTFYKKDPDEFERIFRDMIYRAYRGENPQRVVDQAATTLTQSLK